MVSSLVVLMAVEDGLLVVDVGGALQRVDRHLEDDEVQQRLGPLTAVVALRCTSSANCCAGLAVERRLERVGRGPPHLGGQTVADVAQSLDRLRGRAGPWRKLATLGFQPCWVACFQKLVKSGGMNTPTPISQPSLLELGDLGGEVLGAELELLGMVGGETRGRPRPAPSRVSRRCRRRRSGTWRRPSCWSAPGSTCRGSWPARLPDPRRCDRST